jgi:surfactin synthase thioesterase subunit
VEDQQRARRRPGAAAADGGRAEHSRWLFRFGDAAAQAGIRLVCLPHAGGAATFYLPLARALEPSVEVLAVQYPGRQERLGEPCLETIGELAAGVGEALSGTPGPIALFGHSMGATVGFELAARLERASVEVACLFVSARVAPCLPRTSTVYQLSDSMLLAEVFGLGGTDPRVAENAELLELLLPSIRADYKAIGTYPVSLETLSCPIVALAGDADPRASIAEVRQWQRHTTGRFALHTFPGGHFFLGDHVAGIRDIIVSALSPSSTDTPR